MADNDQDKTEEPTSRRREEARADGNVATSTEVATFFVILGGLLTLYLTGLFMAEGIMKLMRQPLFPFDVELTRDNIMGLWKVVLHQYYIIMIPAFMIPLFGVLAYVLQNGVNLTAKPLMPTFSKLNPLDGLKRMFSTRSLVELAKSVLKIVVLGYVMYINIRKEWNSMPSLVEMEVVTTFIFVTGTAFKIMLKTVWVLAIIAGVDYVYQVWHYEKGLKMSKEEVKEESKESEGDPMVKARIRSIQREQAQKRMMQAVPDADVVVTNPTHLAIAIKYERMKHGAPVVVAKGSGLIADRIREIAEEHNVPLVEDKPLAKSLFKLCEIGVEIPVTLYKAIAEILAYVYRLNSVGGAAGGR
jgi:flagellar biosynthetic protein FlhB